MTVARSAGDVLSDHTVFEIESIDRMYCNVWVPRLAYGAGVQGFFVGHRGHHYASTALMDPMTKAFVADINGFVAARGLELVTFGKERKDDVAQQFLARFTGTEGVLFVGRAQEKALVWRTQRRYNDGGRALRLAGALDGVRQLLLFLLRGRGFRPVLHQVLFLLPLHRQAVHQRQRVGQTPGRQGRDRVRGPGQRVRRGRRRGRLQRICDSLGPEQLDALLRKWLKILPNPFTDDDEAAGYRYELSILQAEFSLTQMLDRPVSGRIFFEQVLHDNLDIGRPDQVGLIFDRRIIAGRAKTPGRFRTRVITDGVTPSLHVNYKNTKVKQYHKEGRALRTETTINNPHDFRVTKRLTSLPELRQIGFSANRRLLGVQTISHDPIRGAQAFRDLTTPVVTEEGTRIPGLRFGDNRVHALLQALLIHRLLVHGFTNRDLRTLIAPLLGTTAEDITAGQMTYDLRRLRAHGLIERVPRTRRYTVTDTGLQHALLFTHAHDHLLRAGLAQVADPSPPRTSKLHNAARAYQAAFDDLTQQARLAA